MNPALIVLIVIAVVLVVAFIVLTILGKKAQKRKEEQDEQIAAASQTVNMLIIDKKRMKLKDAGLPQQIIEQTPKLMRRSKLPVVKAKVGPRVMTLIADEQIFDEIPLKKEVKASVSGIYITAVRGIRGPLEKPKKKKGFRARMAENYSKANEHIDVTVAYKFIVDIKCILYLCPYLVLSLLYLYACGINTYLDTSKRCIIICQVFLSLLKYHMYTHRSLAGELKIIVIEFKHIFECLGLTLHYLLKKHIVLVISYIILSRGNHLYRIRLLVRCEL